MLRYACQFPRHPLAEALRQSCQHTPPIRQASREDAGPPPLKEIQSRAEGRHHCHTKARLARSFPLVILARALPRESISVVAIDADPSSPLALFALRYHKVLPKSSGTIFNCCETILGEAISSRSPNLA